MPVRLQGLCVPLPQALTEPVPRSLQESHLRYPCDGLRRTVRRTASGEHVRRATKVHGSRRHRLPGPGAVNGSAAERYGTNVSFWAQLGGAGPVTVMTQTKCRVLCIVYRRVVISLLIGMLSLCYYHAGIIPCNHIFSLPIFDS